jgi:hypothetical protein
MQPTEQQIQRSLEALRTRSAGVSEPTSADVRVELVPPAVALRLRQEPVLRVEHLERARRRLARGDTPSAEALAERMIGRLLCDRLR